MQKKLENKNLSKPMTRIVANKYVLPENISIKLDEFAIPSLENGGGNLLGPISISFPKNEIIFIVGDSGVGKSTLVSYINGITKSKNGNIFIKHSKIIGTQRKIKNVKVLRKTIAMVAQFPEYQLFKSTVLKDVIFGPRNLGVKKKEAIEIAKNNLTRLSIGEELYERSPFELSGGQKRRVAIAGILSLEPEILIFDEPTGGLDPVGVNEVLTMITNLKKSGKTIFIITHDMNHALAIADRVVVLKDSKIFLNDEPYIVFTNKELLGTTTLIKPRVIQLIEDLIEINKIFVPLLLLKPKTVDELGDFITKIIIENNHD